VAALSGFCALAYEVLYLRHLTTLLGDMLYVHAALLGTFLVGVGLGAWVAHRFHRWLFAFEMATGLYALLLPSLTDRIGRLPALATIAGAPVLTIAATMALVAVPSVLVGFSLPLLSAYVKALAPGRRAFQGIYTLYNAGAFAGILAVELLMVRRLGIPGALAVVGLINIANGLALFGLQAGSLPRPATESRRFDTATTSALALASATSAAFQMLFLQLLYLVFGPHRENFAVGLAVVLGGIALGTALVARTRARFPALLRALPVALAVPFLLHVPLVRLYQALLPHAVALDVGGAVLMLKLGVAAAYGLAPLALFGGLVPALLHREWAVDEESGFLLWVSSLANATGYLAYVLFLHALVPTHLLLLGFGGVALVAAWMTGRAVERGPRMAAARLLAGSGFVALIVLALTWSEPRLYLARWLDDLGPEVRVTVLKSGAESASLLEAPDFRWVSYNGHPSIYVSRAGVVNTAEVVSGVIPALAAPRLERVAVLGLGTGITAGTAATLFRHTDAVEINRAFVRMQPLLADANLGLAASPSATIHVTDARAFLLGRDSVYDAIINSIPAPTYFSAGKIYTVEFYRRVARALKPDGVFSTWLAPPEMTAAGVRTVLATLSTAFRYCDLRRMRSQYYMATCSNQPIDVRPFPELPVGPELSARLARGLETDPGDYFRGSRVRDNVLADPALTAARLNTDRFPILEFLLARPATPGADQPDPFLRDRGSSP
jgi:predicted membrane-bound spermidine synthase